VKKKGGGGKTGAITEAFFLIGIWEEVSKKDFKMLETEGKVES